jgi:hypothetical protein
MRSSGPRFLLSMPLGLIFYPEDGCSIFLNVHELAVD